MEGTFLRIDSGLKIQIPDADIPERQRRAGEVMFADMISMGDMSKTEDFQVDVMDEAVGSISSDKTEIRKEKPTDAYEKYQYKDKTIREESKTVSEQDAEKVETEVAEFTENVTEVIEEELHVSKEEIEAAMEELGLTFLDLLDAGNLANLVAKLSGEENTNQLLCNEVFTNILQQVNAFGKEMFAELQMTPEEVLHIQAELEKLATNEFTDTMEQVVAETVNEEENNVSTDVLTADKVVENADDVLVVRDEKVLKETTEVTEETSDVTEDKVAIERILQESSEDDFAGTSDNSEESSEYSDLETETVPVLENQTTEVKAEAHVLAFDATTNTISVQANTPEAVQSLPTYISVTELMEQFVEQTRVHITQDANKMEMLLNPEHLGKLYLEITEQEGSVTAKIQTQNTIVKEALEMQIADLRQNLSQAGVKVDAIEVTIASHEFERNLEQDANSKKQQEDVPQKTARIRNIDMNDLDNLSGLMTEEEAIVAKMMAEQGNRVNFTA